jgi:uncharacterized alkaline shock family protein YloU
MASNDEIVIGEMKIAANVLERMVRESAGGVPGVSQVKNIEITPKEKSLDVGINLAVDHNTVYPEVGADVQNAIIDDIARSTSVKVDEVNVMIERLDFSKE